HPKQSIKPAQHKALRVFCCFAAAHPAWRFYAPFCVPFFDMQMALSFLPLRLPISRPLNAA
ncbi:MAG: hypothetical protein ACRC02_11790, partial [Vogesella sp.]|uniref:hypothetical protein n=1 Tax=Vogesella sp. TaxID=1904252 RepID=UPI003F3A40A5